LFCFGNHYLYRLELFAYIDSTVRSESGNKASLSSGIFILIPQVIVISLAILLLCLDKHFMGVFNLPGLPAAGYLAVEK